MKTNQSLDFIFASEITKSLIDEVNLRWQQEQMRRNQFVFDLIGEEKAEFINGEVITQSPAKARHILVTEKLIKIIGFYLDYYPIGQIYFEKALVRMTRNDYEPDLIFYHNETATQIQSHTDIFPVPDFIIEILSPSTENRDRGVKFRDYARHNVKEYWIIDPVDEQIEQYLLNDESNYELKSIQDTQNIPTIESEVISGLHFPIQAVFDNQVLKTWVAEFFNKMQ